MVVVFAVRVLDCGTGGTCGSVDVVLDSCCVASGGRRLVIHGERCEVCGETVNLGSGGVSLICMCERLFCEGWS